jgi:predicted PurR-regulated permease PerM
VSTWATLIAIVAGGLLWGVSGMILFIPFLGILKIVSENIPEWEALNILLSRGKKDKVSPKSASPVQTAMKIAE